MSVLIKNIRDIRAYTKRNPELLQAHHFLFDLPLRLNSGEKIRFIVMGINPGETKADYKVAGPTEETSACDFHNEAGRSKSSQRWLDLVKEFCATDKVVLTEVFFWSSSNVQYFSNRFGPFEKWPHLQFCKTHNEALLDHYEPRGVLFPGIGCAKHVSALYGLTHRDTLRAANGHRLIERFDDGKRPWIFTKHWTGSHGFSREQRDKIKNYIARL